MNCEQLAKIINIQGVEAAFSILYASDESDNGTWMQLLYEMQGLVDDVAIAKLLRMLWINNSDNVDREVAIKIFIKYGKQSMDSKELAIVNEWEDIITVYRGGFGTGTDISLPVIPVLSHRGWFGMVENGWKFIWVAAIMILLPFVSSLVGIILGSIQLKKTSTKPVKIGVLLSCTGLVLHLLFRFVFKL